MKRLAKDQIQIRLTGAGGQGVITAGVILAEAGLRDGLNVVQTQSYGPEARLGASKAEVIISKSPIAYPEVTVPDILVCLSKDSARKYLPHVRDHTLVLLDASADDVPDRRDQFRLPLARTAADSGAKNATNVVALWVLNSIVQVVSPRSLRDAIMARVPAKYRASNEQALEGAEQLVAAAIPQSETAPCARNNGVCGCKAAQESPV